jgi:hypothetical protein
MQLFSADATIFKKKLRLLFAPQNCPKKLLIITLNQEILVQQVFGFVELKQFFTLFFFSSLKLSNFAG